MANLRDWRTRQNMTLAELAARLGIEGVKPERTVQRLETGERAASLVVAMRIERVTKGAVTAADMQKTRERWTRETAEAVR